MRMLGDPAAHAAVAAVPQTAGPLGVDVVAEGVETDEECEALLALGCRHGQGFLFGRPQAAQALAVALDRRRPSLI